MTAKREGELRKRVKAAGPRVRRALKAFLKTHNIDGSPKRKTPAKKGR